MTVTDDLGSREGQRRHRVKRGRPRGRREGPRKDEDDKGRGKRIIDKIVRLAKSRDMTQSDLEEKLNLPHGRITKWLGGRTEPGGSVVWAAAKLLAVDVEYLLDPEAEVPAVPGRDEYEQPMQLVRYLGFEESMRRLTKQDGPARSAAPGDGRQDSPA